ncbi:Unannotated, partial [Lentimonas sp. CC10]
VKGLTAEIAECAEEMGGLREMLCVSSQRALRSLA